MCSDSLNHDFEKIILTILPSSFAFRVVLSTSSKVEDHVLWVWLISAARFRKVLACRSSIPSNNNDVPIARAPEILFVSLGAIIDSQVFSMSMTATNCIGRVM